MAQWATKFLRNVAGKSGKNDYDFFDVLSSRKSPSNAAGRQSSPVPPQAVLQGMDELRTGREKQWVSQLRNGMASDGKADPRSSDFTSFEYQARGVECAHPYQTSQHMCDLLSMMSEREESDRSFQQRPNSDRGIYSEACSKLPKKPCLPPSGRCVSVELVSRSPLPPRASSRSPPPQHGARRAGKLAPVAGPARPLRRPSRQRASGGQCNRAAVTPATARQRSQAYQRSGAETEPLEGIPSHSDGNRQPLRPSTPPRKRPGSYRRSSIITAENPAAAAAPLETRRRASICGDLQSHWIPTRSATDYGAAQAERDHAKLEPHREAEDTDSDSESDEKELEDQQIAEAGQGRVLKKFKFQGSKFERLKYLSQCRKLRLQEEAADAHPDRFQSREAVELARESFGRHLSDAAAGVDKMALFEALADYGIQARNRSEKIHLSEVASNYDDRNCISFSDFQSLVDDARTKLRQAYTSSVFCVWQQSGAEDSGGLDNKQLLKLLIALNLGPANDNKEEIMVGVTLSELDWDIVDRVSFHEADYFAWRVREYRTVTCRRRERELQSKYKLSASVFAAFRSQLIDLHTEFIALDEDSSGSLDAEEIINLLFDLGCLKRKPGGKATDVIVTELLQGLGVETVDFPIFLQIIDQLRAMDRERMAEEVQTLFNMYDGDGSGELDMKEVCRILSDFKMMPKTAREQDGIAHLMDEVDLDGSGRFNFAELLDMLQRICEKVTQIQRAEENKKAEELGFPRREANSIRRAFELLDMDGSCVISLSEVDRAVKLMGYKVSWKKIEDLLEEFDADGSGVLNFLEFLALLRRLSDDALLAEAEEQRRKGKTEMSRASIGPTLAGTSYQVVT